MKRSLATTILKVFPIVAVGVLLLTNAKPAHAMPCFTELANCYFDAALENSFWYRWARGLDCELGFISCAREDIIGR